MSQPRATVNERNPSEYVHELDFHWASHVPHWERPAQSDRDKCFARLNATGHVNAGWVTIHTREKGAKSAKETMVTLAKEDAERLALWILKTNGWVDGDDIGRPGAFLHPKTLPQRTVGKAPTDA